ncbi:MAG: ABC transporter ATP-binding protein [Ktedonobacterales bacterium]|nr:ABC transporter ATP-binding protein [Ktedonobacterales bacterium]
MERISTLVMQGVTREFAGTTVLHHIDLTIGGGSFVTLLGPSGCGKTTALNCLAGLLELSGGAILVNGRPIQNLPPEKRNFGMVFQNYALFPHLTVARNVSYGLEVRGVNRAERDRRVARALEMVHLEAFGKRYPAQLSGGQQQRLAIARTIVLEPQLLLLDEPLSNLDTNLRNEMRIEIKRIHTQLNLTTVYVTHDQSEALSLSDQIVVMKLGNIEQVGTPQEIYDHPKSLYVANFMGYANQLRGTITGHDGQQWLVRTTGGAELRATATDAISAGWGNGQGVILASKPTETLSGEPGMVNGMTGQPMLAEYMGNSFEVLVLTPEGQMLVHMPSAPAATSTVTFGIRPERLLAFADDAAARDLPTPSLNGTATPIAAGR